MRSLTDPTRGTSPTRVGSLRQDGRGDLLVPMRDKAGKVQNVQTIKSDAKLYMKDAVKTGLHLRLGDLRPGEPVVIAEEVLRRPRPCASRHP